MARKKYDWGGMVNDLREQGSTGKKSFGNDVEVYKPQRVNGKFKGLIRFLPPSDTNLPIVQYSQHFFKGRTGKYVVEPCSYGIAKRKCPICADNQQYWDKEGESYSPKIGRARKQSKDFYANILVIKDQNNPKNEGQVFLYRFPETIYKKIMQKVAPPPEEADFIKPVMVFDYDEGADFVLDITEKKDPDSDRKFPNYDGSFFAEPAPIQLNNTPLTDDEIDEIEEARKPMKHFLDENVGYKSEDELKTLLKEADGANSFTGGLVKPPKVEEKAPEKVEVAEESSVGEANVDDFFSEESESTEDEDAFFKDLD